MEYNCEKCNKLVIEKFGSGRFCSRSCANSHVQTDVQNQKRRKKLKKPRVITISECQYCNKKFEQKLRRHKLYCSLEWARKGRWTPELKKTFSEIAKKNNFGGTQRKKLYKYKDIYLDSSYEVTVAESLDLNKIKWSRPNSFKYTDLNGILHNYTPDFYLIDYDVYLDPKNDYLINNINKNLGYKDIDKIKWVSEQNNIKIFILNKNQLNWNAIKNIINNN